jgi:hypothetical protein
MDLNITGILFFIMLIIWQVFMWKKIKLKKWQNLTLSAIMIGLCARLVYLAFIS